MAAAALASASCSSPPGPPLGKAEEADLTLQAIAEACGDICISNPLYIRDQLLGIATLAGEEEPMPVEVRQAIGGAYPAATFVDFDAVSRVSDDIFTGTAALVYVSEVTQLAPGVLGIEVGVTFESFLSRTIQFLWDGSDWVVAESDETGVTVTTSVS